MNRDIELGKRGAKTQKENEKAQLFDEDTSVNRDRTDTIRDPLLSDKEVSCWITIIVFLAALDLRTVNFRVLVRVQAPLWVGHFSRGKRTLNTDNKRVEK